jgi:hypothetical protein
MVMPCVNSIAEDVRESFHFDGVRLVEINTYGPELQIAVSLDRFDRATRDLVSHAKTTLYRRFPGQVFDFTVIDESQSDRSAYCD